MKPKQISPPLQALFLALFVLAVWLAGLRWFTSSVDEAAFGNSHAPADAIVVLTGGSNRLQTGFDLLDKKLGKKLFISGVYRGVDVKELMARWQKGGRARPDGDIVLGFEADDTIGNARETVDWIKREKYSSFYLVTSNYHLKRALLEFRIVAPKLNIIPYPVTPEGLDMKNWWRNKAHRTLVIGEYNKYIFSLLRYAITETPA